MSSGTGQEWMAGFRQRVAAQRVPLSGMLELTRRCNLRCVHCYLGSERTDQPAELSTAQVVRVIDQIWTAGCLHLVLTGGDPMMRRDFFQIYRHAKERGMVVSVFCNGTLIDDTILALFDELPPHLVEITLLGAKAATHDGVTGARGSFERCMASIHNLVDRGIHVGLKTVALTLNRHELDDMQRCADSLGLRFRIDSAVFPELSGTDRSAMELRVTPEEALRVELGDPRRVQQWIAHVESGAVQPPHERLYVCGAATCSFFVDAFGNLSPCLMMRRYRFSLLDGDFDSLWREELARLVERRAEKSYPCLACEIRYACTTCPAFNELERGCEHLRSEYVCKTARLRWQMLQQMSPGSLPPVAPTNSSEESIGR